MGLITRVVGLLTLTCLLAGLIDEGASASAAATFRIIRRGRRTQAQGGYGGGAENSVATAPDLPALYSAPKESPAALYSAPKEHSEEAQNDALEQGTTTELISSSEDQPQSLEDVGVSEDYVFSTVTQVPGAQDTTGPSSSEESSNEASEVSDKRNSEVTAAGGGGGGYDYQPKARTSDKGQEETERANEILSNTVGHQSYFKARDQQQVENQEHFQVQTQAPSPVQEPKPSYEQIAAVHQPTRFLAQSEHQDLPVARQFEQQGGYSQRESEVPQPESRYGSPQPIQQQQQPQQLYQQPRSQPQQLYQQPQPLYQQPQSQPQPQAPQQLYQQPQVQQQLYQQPPPQPQQQYGHSEQTPQPTNYYQPGQQTFLQNIQPQHQQHQQRQPEVNSQPEQQPPREYLRQQEQPQPVYQPQPHDQRQSEPQVQYGTQFNQQPQQQQQQYQVQGQQRALYQPPSQELVQNKIEQEDTVVLEGLNDNVVDAELLERVQQIIEEHERQQKAELLRLRQSQRQREETPVKDNEVLTGTPNEFQVPQSNIYTDSIQPSLNPNPNTNNGNRQQGYDSRPPPPAPAPTQYYARNNEDTAVVPQQPQQRSSVEPPRNIPQSYFPQGGYQNQQGGPEPVRNYEEGNRGRALSDNKHIDFQPAILTSHFVQSGRKNGASQNQSPQTTSTYLPVVQQNEQPQQQPFPAYQQQQPQNIYPQQPQQHGDPNARGLQPAYQVAQPQQPETYFIQQQRQQQPQYFQQQQPAPVLPAQGGYATNYEQNLAPAVQHQQQPEQERREIPDGNQENSLEYYQTPGGYSQTQQVYALPIQQTPAVYQQPQPQQQYVNYQPEQQETPNVITRTIVIHEQPTSVYGADNNRAIITADDLRGGAQYSQSGGQIFQQPQEQPQQYQYLTASAQINIAPETGSVPQHFSAQPQPINAGKDIISPKPIYGIPLAPALGPNDNLDSQSSNPNYLPPAQGNSIYEDNSPAQSQRSYTSGGYGGALSEGATPVRSAAAVELTNNTPVPLVSSTVPLSLPTREYFPSSESNIEQTTQPVSLPYGRRIDRHIRKRFSSAVTSPLAGFFSVKTNNSSSST